MDKIKAIFTTPSGLALVATFIVAGLTAIQSHFTGSVSADIGVVISIIGMIFHPTELVGGRSVKK